jgi:DNA repair protein RecO (recombination protein O)
MKSLVTQGIVLRRTNFGEADRILTVLTPNHGKIRLVAKGVRRIKSKLAGGIELLTVNDLTYMPGKSELGTLISSRLLTNFGNIITDVNRTMYAYEVLKLIDSATEDSPEPDYFHLLGQALEGINEPSLSLNWVRTWLYLQLLVLNGHAPNLQTNPSGQPLDSKAQFTFSFEDMAFVEHDAGVFDARAVKLLRLSCRVASPLALGQVAGANDLLEPLSQLTKTMYLDYSHRS